MEEVINRIRFIFIENKRYLHIGKNLKLKEIIYFKLFVVLLQMFGFKLVLGYD